MACLATWKEGSSRYFVSMLNHSHVYTDETRYRCFVYQRQHSNELGRVTYKMAQSLYASCLGLWNVNEGHKTFTMTKCKPFLFCFSFLKNSNCSFLWTIGFLRIVMELAIKSYVCLPKLPKNQRVSKWDKLNQKKSFLWIQSFFYTCIILTSTQDNWI